MEPLNLKIALILITLGTELLMISVSPYGYQGLACTLTQDACAQVAAQEATTHFFEYFIYGTMLISGGVIVLIMGRDQGSSRPTGVSYPTN